MTLNDIIIRDLELNRRDRELASAERTMQDYEREINRRMRHRRMKAAGEVAAGIVTLALVFALAWLCMACSGYHWE